MNDILTIAEVAELLRCSRDTVRKLADSGRIKSIKITTGRKVHFRFLRKNVLAFVEGDEPVKDMKSKSVPMVRGTFMKIGG